MFRWVNGKNPRQYGVDFGLWTRQIERELIAQRFGVRLSLASIGALLAGQGLTSHGAKGAPFWFATYGGALTGPLFVDLLRRMLRGRRTPLHLILDGLSAHKSLAVKEYVAGLDGKLTLHYLPGYAPDLIPDELVWSHAKRTGKARRPLQEGE